MNKKEILAILQHHTLSPSKKLGQNFIWNDDIIRQIADAADILPDMTVLEIGPGLGALTEELSRRCKRLICVEFDRGIFNYLSERYKETEISFIHGDFLKTEITEKVDRVVSNLPYYCASEILFKIAEELSPPVITVMMQKEMAERIVSLPGDESYGALTVNLSLEYKPEIIMQVAGDNFYPEPDVKSTVVKFTRVDEQLNPELKKLFKSVVKAAFWGRRKTLTKALSSSPHLSLPKHCISEALAAAGIDPSERGENLSTAQFLLITQNLFGRK